MSTVRVTEIADILGVTHKRASKIIIERGFPKPVGREGQSRLWNRRDVVAWAKGLAARGGPGANGGRLDST